MRLPGRGGDSFKRRAACAGARALTDTGPGTASIQELGSWRGRPGKEVARNPGPESVPRGRGQKDAEPSGAPCLPASLRKFAGAADAAARGRRPPRPHVFSSLSPPARGPVHPLAAAPGPAVRGGEAAAGLAV